MKKRFLGFILSVLMVAGTINPAVLNAKTTINPQEFINSAFRRPGDDLDLQPTDEDGNPKIKGFDKSLAYMSERKESEEPAPAENTGESSVSAPEESTKESTTEQSTEEKSTEKSKEEEIKTVDKKYWKDGEEHTDFLSTVKELEKQLKKKSKDFTINVSFDCNTIKKYRESTWSVQNSQKDSKGGEAKDDEANDANSGEAKDPEEDGRKDSDLVLAMVQEALFNNRDNKELTKEDLTEEELVDGLENSVSSGTKERLAELGVTALAQETKDDEILVGRFYTTLHYNPVYEGEEETTTEKTEEQKSEEKTEAEKESITEQKEKTTEESKEPSSEQQKDSELQKESEGTTLTQNTTESTKEKKSKTQSGISVQAIDNAPETDVTINFLTAQFISGAKKEKNQWVWTPVNATSDHMFVFRINYSTSGVADVPAGGFKITVPKQILRERSGDFADFFTMSLPQKDDEVDDTDEDTEYAWKTEGDNIVIYNCKEITAAQNGYFDIGYSTDKETYYYQDMGESEPFFGTLEIDGKTATTDKIHVVINTQATINYTNKYYPDLYRDWNDSWGTKPADADDYYYLVWMIGTDINHVTQNYNFTLEDNVTSKDGKVELVGYKMSGSSNFSQVNTVNNIHSEGIRYDYVLTKHLKSDFDPKLTYKIENNIKATVDPVDQVDPDTDAVASREFKWERPVFHIPTGRFTIWKYGDENWHRRFGYHRDYSSYELAEFKEGKKTTLNDLNYMVWAAGFPAPWTLEKGKYSDDPEAYYKNPVTYTITDDVLYLVDPTDTRLSNEVLDDDNTEGLTPLAPEDYDIRKLTFRMAAKDGSYDDFNKDFETSTHTANENDVLTFQIKVDNEWKNAGTVNLGTGEVKIEDDHVKFLDTTQIQFNDGVKGWRMSATNAYYESNFYVYPYVDLHRTDNTLALTDGEDMVILKNTTNLTVTYDKDFDGTSDDEIVSLNRVIGDRIRQIEKDSSLDKRAITSSNNVRKKYYDIGWRVNQSEVMTTGKGEKEYIRQNGGTFYDLLPKGSAFKKGTLSVKTDEGTLKESQYSYELKEDWKQSGRTMLIVRIKPQAKWYSVYYHTQHSWDSIKDYGKDVKNPVAYETGNNEITNGYPDNGGKLSIDKDLMSDLDETTDDPKFLYSEDAHWINALTAAISGLDKKVMTADDSDWSYETFTHPDGIYQYRWRFANNFTSDSKDMIFFDSLENYVVKTGEKSDWHGILQRIDTSQLESKGIQPVIYVSEQTNLDLDQHHDLTDTSIWKRVDSNTDLIKAKAVAIDVRKKTDGKDFVLKSGDSVNAILYMKAPSTVQDDLHRYPVTYNNIYIEDTVIDSDGGTYDYFIHQDYTKVKYKITGDFSLDKVSSENADKKIEGIKFRLTGTSDFGTEINEIRETDQDGHIDFKGIEKGEYILQEYGSLPDWLEDHTEHKVIIHGDRSVTIDGEKKSNVVITNKPRIHADISFIKTDLTRKTRKLSGAKFKLYGTSDYGNEVILYAVSGEDGKVVFENVELGSYKLKELEAPEGYIAERDEYTVVVDQSANFSISNYKKTGEKKDATKVSHTPNVKDDGTQNGNYGNSLNLKDVVTIPGAKSLKVKIVYGGESSSYDWVCAWEGSHEEYSASADYSKSFTGKLGGGNHTSSSNTKEYTVNGDTVTFGYKSDGSGVGDGYGYWAEITGTVDTVEESGGLLELDKKGDSLFTNEPLHDLRLVKKSSYDGNTVAGASFHLMGTSDYGTKVNLTATSETNGFIDFKGLEAGSYVLQETNAPDGFRLDGTKRTVTITKMGDITISGIAQNKYGNFDITNQKIPDGQVTVIKKWKDKKKPEERTMPTIKISGKKPDITYSGEATIGKSQWSDMKNSLSFRDGKTFQKDNGLYTVKSFLKKHPNAKKVDDDTTEKSIYVYKDDESNFYWWTDAEKVYLAEDSSYMFSNCSSITSLDVTNFDTSKVTDMSRMFYGCSKLTSLDVTNFDTSNVTSMTFMFSDCSSLTSLDVTNFDTSKVTYMFSMFYGCSGLTSLDVTNFDTSKVTDMGYMFSGCSGLTNIYVSEKWSTDKVTNSNSMFYRCTSLPNFDSSKTNKTNAHYGPGGYLTYKASTTVSLGSKALKALVKLTNPVTVYAADNIAEGTSGTCTWTISTNGELVIKPTDGEEGTLASFNNMAPWYNYRSKITSARFEGKVFGESNCSSMFSECSGLTSLDVTNFDTSKVTYMYYMFYGCSGLTSLDVTNFDTSKVTDMGYMFYGCSGLTSLDLSNFDTSKVTSMTSMFSECSGLTSLDLSNFDTSKVTSMTYMFFGCSSITSLDVTNFDTSKVTNMSSMFYGCSGLTSLDLSNFDTSKVTSMTSMFSGCSSITSLDVTNFDTSQVTYMHYMFSGCSGLTSLDLSNFDTSKVTSMTSMFSGCNGLTSLDLSNFDTSKVTSMSYMFYNCSSLTSLDLSNFDTSKVTYMSYMFSGCSGLSILKLGKNFKSLKNTYLPIPSPTGTEEGQYTGKWTRGIPYNHADALTADNFMNTYSGDTMADTWYWERNGQDPIEQTYTSISDRVFNPADFTITDDMTQEQKDALTTAREALLAQYQIEDSDGNAGYWTHIDDNTDMYTFYVYDPNINWNVWEDDAEGDYNTDYDITNPYVLASDAVDKTATITNTIPEEDTSEFGNLSITKRVVNWDDSDTKDSREFTFKITLTDADGNALEGNEVYGETAFINGKATITLTDDETVEFSDIPAGYLYKVEEVTPSGYTLSMTGDTGTITKDSTSFVNATNKKDKPSKEEENPKYTSFTLTKKLTGNFEEKSGNYKFQIALTDLAPLMTYSLSNGKTFTSDENGTADVEVTLAPDESITVENIPVGAKYTITEDAGDYFSSYEITDSNKLGKIQKSRDSNTEKEKALSTSQETADDGEAITITYSNRIQDVQDLKLAKKVVNSKGAEVKDNGQYEITIHFEDMKPNSSFDSDLGPIQADDDGIAELTTYVKGGDVINFSQVPIGVSYKFTESANDKIASYIVSDSNNIGKINSIKAGNDVEQKELSTVKEVVNKGENVTVTFYNAKSVMGSLKLIKKDGNKLLKGVTFTLAQSDGTEVGTATTDENGEVLFDELEEGTYTVTEKQTTKGHSLLTEPFIVTIPYTIKKDKAEEANMDTSKAVLMGDTYYYYDLTYTVDNSHTLNLPKTGADSKSYVWVTFAIAAIISVEYYLATRKHKRRAKHD